VRIPFGARKVRGIALAVADGGGGVRPLQPIASVVMKAPVAAPPLDRLFEWISQRYVAPRGRALALAVPPRVRVDVGPPIPLAGGPSPQRILCYEGGNELVDVIESSRAGTWCVQARAGEDRAALIAELVAAAGRAGGGAALVAVPEVRYGSDVLDRLTHHWPEAARVDSSQAELDRSAAWARLGSGHGLGAGGRAAVLAPAPEVRLVLVDEEHHVTYKEDRAPRYDAVQVAVRRARLQNAVCVLVSATPSVQLGAAAVRGDAGWAAPSRDDSRGHRPLIELFARPDGAALSHELHVRIRDALRLRTRVGLLAAGRGYARAMWCAACRRSLRCPRCESGLFYDRSARSIRCSRCGFRSVVPDRCPVCSSTDWRFVGAGSERLAEQLASIFPRARVLRVDPEVLDASGAESRPSFDEADIYLTTWIGTKPVLRPDVSLVGVLDADALIRRPEWQSSERAYQALAALAEWAGPARSGGRLVIQTDEPRHHSIQAVMRADYRYFLERELRFRRELGYPPYSELVKVAVWGPAEKEVLDDVRGAATAAGARVLGPMNVARGQAQRAREVLLKCPSTDALSGPLRDIVIRTPAGTTVRVDADPR
jgi:primosomal protein N' (replication factor Y) (superfamily II helicase)